MTITRADRESGRTSRARRLDRPSGGPTTTYGYYPDGSLDTIAWSPVAGQFKYAYTLNGQYGTITFPNGQTRSYGYDDQGRLTQLANLHPTVGTLASFAYGYDVDPQTQQATLLGQRTSLAMTIPSASLTNATSTYRYDASYQLTQASYPTPAPYNGEVHSWTYDAIGNRLTNTVNGTPQTYTYLKNGSNPLNGQRLQSDGVNAYTYDANGNTVTRNGSGGSFTFGWNTDDRMTSISGAATASYGYDYQGRRASKTVSGTTTSYLYDGLNLIQTTGSTTTAYLFGPGIDEPLATVQGGSVAYFSVDGLGSAHILSDATGTVDDAYLYDAWGVTKSEIGTRGNDFGYTGREFGEANLWYHRARYYQPEIGRLLSEDPVRLLAGPNFYGYANGNPVSFVDSMGLSPAGPGCTWVQAVSLGDVGGVFTSFTHMRWFGRYSLGGLPNRMYFGGQCPPDMPHPTAVFVHSHGGDPWTPEEWPFPSGWQYYLEQSQEHKFIVIIDVPSRTFVSHHEDLSRVQVAVKCCCFGGG